MSRASLLPLLSCEEGEVVSMCQYSSKVFGRQCDRPQQIPVIAFQPRVRWLADQYRLVQGLSPSLEIVPSVSVR